MSGSPAEALETTLAAWVLTGGVAGTHTALVGLGPADESAAVPLLVVVKVGAHGWRAAVDRLLMAAPMEQKRRTLWERLRGRRSGSFRVNPGKVPKAPKASKA